ncbi:MAG: 3D domain-containing protein [Eubacteriales bacterium]|jgi:3D (Asp-Asp-Asp) domain-containing protein
MPDKAKKTGGSNYFQSSPEKENKKPAKGGQMQGENDIKPDIVKEEIDNKTKTKITELPDVSDVAGSNNSVPEKAKEYKLQDDVLVITDVDETNFEENIYLTEDEPAAPDISAIISEDDESGDIESVSITNDTEQITEFLPEKDVPSVSAENTFEEEIISEVKIPDEEETRYFFDIIDQLNTEEIEQLLETPDIEDKKPDAEQDIASGKEEESDTDTSSVEEESHKPDITDISEPAEPLGDETKSDETEITSEESTEISAKTPSRLDVLKTKIGNTKISAKGKDLLALIKPAASKFNALINKIGKSKTFAKCKKTLFALIERAAKTFNALKAKIGNSKFISKIKTLLAPIQRKAKQFLDSKNIDEKKAAFVSIVASLTVLIGFAVLLFTNYIFNRLPTGLDTHIMTKAVEVKPAAENTAFAGLDDKVNISYTIRGAEPSALTIDKITVGQFMRQISEELTPGEDGSENWEYIINYSKSAVLEDDMELKMDLVTFIDTEIFETIPYEINKIETDTIPKGTKILLRSGINGTADCIYRQRYLNGELQSSEKISETIDIKPQTEVVYEGVGGKFQAPNGQWIEYLYYFDAEATAYGVDTGWGGDGDYVASGKLAQIGMIAVDPNVIPLGSKCYVIGDSYDIGVVYAEDIGGAIKGNKIDIYMGDDLEAQLRFGRRQMRVYVLDLPD